MGLTGVAASRVLVRTECSSKCKVLKTWVLACSKPVGGQYTALLPVEPDTVVTCLSHSLGSRGCISLTLNPQTPDQDLAQGKSLGGVVE